MIYLQYVTNYAGFVDTQRFRFLLNLMCVLLVRCVFISNEIEFMVFCFECLFFPLLGWGGGGVYVIFDDRTLFARTLNYMNLFIKLQLCNRLMFKIKIIR